MRNSNPMIKRVLLLILTLVLVQTCPLRAGSVASMAWKTSNASELDALSKSDAAQLLTGSRRFALPVKPSEIGELAWADLRGNGSLELVVTMDVNGRGFFNALYVLRKGSTGLVAADEIDGWMIQDLHKVIRDLKHDGQDELVIPTVLFQINTAGTFTWPVVYAWKNGRYVDASRDFPSFYDDHILPVVETQIAGYESKPDRGSQEMSAVYILEKAQIERMLGRTSTAELQRAEQWSSSNDPFLLLAATSLFTQIPGHESQAKAARVSYERALCERHPGMVMCKNLSPH